MVGHVPSAVANAAVPVQPKLAPAAPAPTAGASLAPTDSVRISAAAKALSAGGDQDHDGDSH